MLYHSFFTLINEAYPPVVSMTMMNFSSTHIEFSKVLSSSALTRIHGWFSFFNIARINQTVMTGVNLDSVGKIQIIIVFSHTIVSMQLKPWVEVTLYQSKSMHISYPF